MKQALTAATLVLVALGIGWSLGYHQGLRQERRAWEACQQHVARDRDDRNSPAWALYRSPHDGAQEGYDPIPRLNVPDPRDTPVR